MASQSKLQSATTPSSRLSPLAQPFVFSHRQLALVGVQASSVNDSFSGLDKTWYSSEEGLGFTEQHDGAVNTNSMDDDQSLFRKENHAVEGSQLSGEAIGNLSRHLTDIPAAQVACHNRTNQLKPNLKGAEEGHSADDSFVVAEKDKIDNEDLEVDSPCWKGKNNKNSPFVVTETLDAEFTKSKPESSSILNPKAPQFLPRAVERRSSAPVSMSFKKKPPPSSPLFKNHVSWETTDVFNSDSTTGYFAMLYESEENSQNTHVDNMGGIDDSVIGPNMVMYGDGDCSLLVETLLQLSKSLSTQVGVDADILVDTIHALSELLLVNCSDRLFSEERQLEKIKRAINNLSLVSVKNKDGQSPSIHGSNVEFIQSYLTKSPHSSKLPGTEFQPARSKVVISPPHPEVSNLRKYELQPAKTKVVISPPEVSNLRKYELQPARTEVVISPPEASNLRKYELQPVKTKVVISPPEASNLRKYELQTARTEGVISPPKASNLTKYELLPARTKVVISPPLEASNLRKYELQKMGSAMIMQNFKSFSSDIGNEIAQATMNSSSLGYEMEHPMSPQASIYKDLWLQATQELHFFNKKAWRNNES